MYLDPDSSCSGDSLQFYLVEVASLSDTSWTVLWSAEVPISTTVEEDYASGPINEVLSSGGHYGFLVGWSCEVTYSGGGEDELGTDVGPGVLIGGMGRASALSTLSQPGDTLSLSTYTFQDYSYQQTLYHFH